MHASFVAIVLGAMDEIDRRGAADAREAAGLADGRLPDDVPEEAWAILARAWQDGQAGPGGDAQGAMRALGRVALRHLAHHHAHIFEVHEGAIALLESLEPVVHAPIRAERKVPAPTFRVQRVPPTGAVLHYESPRRLNDLATGLVEGLLEHYGEEGTVRMTPTDTGCTIHLDLRKQSA